MYVFVYAYVYIYIYIYHLLKGSTSLSLAHKQLLQLCAGVETCIASISWHIHRCDKSLEHISHQ